MALASSLRSPQDGIAAGERVACFELATCGQMCSAYGCCVHGEYSLSIQFRWSLLLEPKSNTQAVREGRRQLAEAADRAERQAEEMQELQVNMVQNGVCLLTTPGLLASTRSMNPWALAPCAAKCPAHRRPL